MEWYAISVFPGETRDLILNQLPRNHLKKSLKMAWKGPGERFLLNPGKLNFPEENLSKLKGHYHYICVSRKKMTDLPVSDDFILVKEDKKNKVEVQRITRKELSKSM